MSSLALALAPPAKSVVLYRNGDPFFPGRRFVLNQRHFQTWEVFLKEVTKSIQAPLAVRNLYTPRHGHRLACLGDLQDGCHYVAAGSERFKKLEDSSQLLAAAVLVNIAQAPCGFCPHPQLQEFWLRPCLGCSCCSVFRNGDLLSPPLPLPLSKSSPLQWDTLLAMLTEKVNLRCGAVHRLCRLDGTQVSSGEELLHGHYYVAVGDEEYKKLPYFQLLVPQGSMSSTLWYVD
ncbi:DCD2B protein, partial [Ramphastos sulfuratus]|nr:DCD2B protein [Ramphastos sulfuratus]